MWNANPSISKKKRKVFFFGGGDNLLKSENWAHEKRKNIKRSLKIKDMKMNFKTY